MRKHEDTATLAPDEFAGGSIATLAHPEDVEALPAPPETPWWRAILQFELTPKKVKRKELLHFSRQMSVFIRAGIPIIDALETISSEVKNKFFRQVLEEAAANLRAG